MHAGTVAIGGYAEYYRSTVLFIVSVSKMLPDRLIHLEHQRIGGHIALRLYVCGLRLPRIPASMRPLVVRLFRVPAQQVGA